VTSTPVGGAISRVLGTFLKPVLRRLLQVIGRMNRTTLVGAKGIERVAIKFQRLFVNTNKTYPPVRGTFLGRLLQRAFPKVRWEQHHVFIQQAWSRVGGPNQVFKDLSATEGLRRVGNGLWNLLPIPRSVNSYLGRTPLGTEMFATAYYSILVYGPFHTFDALMGD